MEASKQAKVAATTAVFMLRSSMPSLTEAEAVNLLRGSLQQMTMQEHNGIVTGTSSPAADSRSPTANTGQRGQQDAAPVAAVPPIAAGHTLPLDEDAVSRFRRLPKEVKAGRLIQAAKDGAVSELQALLAAGADVSARDKGCGRTALHWAAARGHTEAARSLVDAGAPLEWRDCMYMTPLSLAASNGHVDVVKMLLASSASPNAAKRHYKSPLEIAVENGHAEVATVLLDAGASKRDRYGNEIIIPGHP